VLQTSRSEQDVRGTRSSARLEEPRVREELRTRGIEVVGPDRKSPKGEVRVSRARTSPGSLQLPIKGSNKNLK
jgi:hypothetical protein